MTTFSPASFLKGAMFLLTFIFGVNTLTAQADIAPNIEEMMISSPETQQEVLLLLADGVDCLVLEERFQRERASLQERAYVTITSLQQKAAATQPGVLAKLRELPGVAPESIEAYWIVNAIFCRADGHALQVIRNWAEIGMIEPDFDPQPLEVDAAPVPAPPVPNGKEPGLSAINAPAMWALGYTGYGRKALIIDSRQEFDHPALRTNFWGNYVPLNQAFTGYEPNPNYCSDHGTHVTGTTVGIDRRTNDTIGVAFNANWMSGPLAFEECSYLSNITPSTLSTFQWSLDPDGDPSTTDDMPDAINCSWSSGEYGCGGTTANLLAAVEAAGIGTVWAAGNNGPDAGTLYGAADMALTLVNSFTVAAVNSNNSIAGFSSRGPSNCNVSSALSTKPEVAAPGVSIRSCVPEGSYGNLQGTSMAAPHVTGALLLLREAFPTLSGTDLKMALYQSAIDLGSPGEDNTYGRGLIDVYAAYQYLIGEGNEPVLPVSFEKDMAIVNLTLEREVFCLGESTPVISFKNAGGSTVTSLRIAYGLTGQEMDTLNWTGTLAHNASETLALPAIALPEAGDFDLVVEVLQPDGQEDPRPLNNRLKRTFRVADLEYVQAGLSADFPDPACNGARVLLRSDQELADNQRIEWYSQFSGGGPLAEGPTFLTPPLTGEETYYVDLITVFNAGRSNLNTGNSDIGDLGAGLLFDADQPFLLRSVKIYAEETGVRIIRLKNAEGNTIQQATMVINQTGEQRVLLNFRVPQENNLTLSLAAGKSLYYNTSNTQFPYKINGLVEIKRSVDAPNSLANFLHYYYFYDWEINLFHECGRTEVQVAAGSGNAPEVDFSFPSDTVYLSEGGTMIFTDESADATSWSWDFGNGTVSTEQHPEAQYFVPGNYLVSLVATNSEGCTSAALHEIVVSGESTSVDDLRPDLPALQLFPNPVRARLHLRFSEPVNQTGRMRVVDAWGQSVLQQPLSGNIGQELTIETSPLPAGLYFLVLESNDGRRWTERFVKQ